MSESCVCCQAAAQKASGVDATLVLLYTLVGDIPVARVVEALCKRHGAALDRMVYATLTAPALVRSKAARAKKKKRAA